LEKKNKIILIIIISLLVILILGLGGYIIYDKVLNKSETQSNSVKATKQYSFKEIELETCTGTYVENFEEGIVCEEKLEVGNKRVIIKLVGEDITVKGNFNYNSKLFINNKEIYDEDTFLEIDKLLIIDQTLVFFIHEGPGVKPNKILLYELNKKTIKEIYSLDEEIPQMTLNVFEESNIKIIKNKIYIDGNRLSHGPTILNSANDNVFICDTEDMEKNNFDYDTIVEAIYEIEYTGKNKFSITRVNEITLNTFISDSLENYCEEVN